MKFKKLLIVTLVSLLAASAISNAQGDEPANLPVLPGDLDRQIREYRIEQRRMLAKRQLLAEELRAMEDAAARRAKIEEFQDAHADDVAALRNLGEAIREQMKEFRTAHERPERDRPERPVDRPEPPAKQLMDDFHAEREELLQRLRDASAEDRQAALEEFRQERAALVARIREEARQVRDEVQDHRDQRRNNP